MRRPEGRRLLRDLFNPSYENIFINDKDVFTEGKDYVTLIAPEKAGIVKQYNGKVPIFDNFNVTKQIKASFGKTVNSPLGAYLIIEHTEAMHVVDVNSVTVRRTSRDRKARPSTPTSGRRRAGTPAQAT
jgi:ribonuclease G